MSDGFPPDIASSTPRPKRPWTILGRLSKAVREQSWFAVALELVIVVLGVVIGFQVTGWGQERADRDKERTYLEQLAADLRQTEVAILWADREIRPRDDANSKLVRAFYAPETPPADSILHWRLEATYYMPLLPVTGTAEALIASGDLSLIQNDSLRSEITTYVPFVKSRQAEYEHVVRSWWEASVSVADRYDSGDMVMRSRGEVAIDSMAAVSRFVVLPTGERRSPFPVDVDAMLADQEAYNGFRRMLEEKSGMERERSFVRYATRRLRTRVEDELFRRWQIRPVPLTDSFEGSFLDSLRVLAFE